MKLLWFAVGVFVVSLSACNASGVTPCYANCSAVSAPDEVLEVPDVPEAPETPEVPSVPEAPETPEVPSVPEAPETPEAPSVPDVPETPEVPSVPDVPETPEVPSVPDVPETPEVPAVPDVPETPEVPDVPETPEAPSVPEVPETPETPEVPEDPDTYPDSASGIELKHRSGQTFITWTEIDSSVSYHVYRHDQPITSDNLLAATQLTSRWGPLGSDTTVNNNAVHNIPTNFVIDGLGSPLSDAQGLFVHTTEYSGTAHYAITTVLAGSENTRIVLGQNSSSVQEYTGTPQPVLTSTGDQFRLYTHYMNYQEWNPTFNGYAFNYYVTLPNSYNSSVAYPLQLELHAYSVLPDITRVLLYRTESIQLVPVDPGDAQGVRHTWWYGHARDHDYQRDGDTPYSGAVENYTQQRVMKALNEVVNNSEFNIDSSLIHAYGNSMGASGAVSFGLHYPSVFSAIYASQPMMNYAASDRFRYNFEPLFGSPDRNLPIVNRGLYSESIQRYGEGGNQATGVWDWMNHHAQVRRRIGDEFAHLAIDFGKADTVIDWQTQGRPTFAAFRDGKVAYSATAQGDTAHSWQSFIAVNRNLFNFSDWRYSSDLSFPALHNATGSGSIDPGVDGTDIYQTTLEWSVPHYSFGQSIVDQANQYEITLRSLASDQFVDVTPRNTQSFRPSVNSVCYWTAYGVANGQVTSSGSQAVDSNGLVTAVQVPVATGSGTRLSFSCS